MSPGHCGFSGSGGGRGNRGKTFTSQSNHSDESELEYALVKWLHGKEANTFTHNVETSWIVNFNPLADYRRESHVVEWRTLPKPKSGWPMLDCEVLEVSADLDFLKQRMEEEKQRMEEEEDHCDRRREIPSTEHHRRKIPVDTPSSTPRRSQHQSGSEDMQALFKTFLSQLSGVSNPSSHSQSLNTDENQVKVGEVLTLSQTAYMEAKLARTPSSMTMDLVRAAFSVKRLRRSSYAGQKRNLNGTIIQKPSLKKYRKMKDIQNFVNQRFAHFSQSAFGHAVNAVTGRNIDKRPPKELVDQSDSESEAD